MSASSGGPDLDLAGHVGWDQIVKITVIPSFDVFIDCLHRYPFLFPLSRAKISDIYIFLNLIPAFVLSNRSFYKPDLPTSALV